MNPNNIITHWIRREGLALLTDFYELTMLSCYLKHGLAEQNVAFEYFFRTLPKHNGFVLTAGLEQFLNYLENLHFNQDDIAFFYELATGNDHLAGFFPARGTLEQDFNIGKTFFNRQTGGFGAHASGGASTVEDQ